MLTHLFNPGDETVVAAWGQNPDWPSFCGLTDFPWRGPCDPGDLGYFRQRRGAAGRPGILPVTVRWPGAKAQEKAVVGDTPVPGKNITPPTATKLAHKMIRRCWQLADRNGVKLRRRYRKAVRPGQRWRKDPKQWQAAQRALRKMKVIAGRLLRELERKRPATHGAAERANSAFYRRVLRQQTGDQEDPQKHEFGRKTSVVMTQTHGVIVGAVAHAENLYDGEQQGFIVELLVLQTHGVLRG